MSLDGKVLVVEDDAAQREMLAGFFRDLGADVIEAEKAADALELVSRAGPDVVVTDLRMPGIDGHQLLRRVREINPEVLVVIVTAYGTVEGAVACLKDGAFDYLLKPLNLDEVEHVVACAFERRALEREVTELRQRLGRIESLPGIITSGGPMADVLSAVARVSRSTVSVLLLGESGTGKELVARAIHSAGARHRKPFVAVSGAALSPTLLESELFGYERGAFTGAERRHQGRFEAANGGTLLLDEVGDLPPEVQIKLLRTLQERQIERVGANTPIPIDVRVIAATHHDLPDEVRAGRFREDLYYRLAVVTIELPPLRRRRSDIPLLTEHFINKHAEAAGGGKTFSREAMDLLVRYEFPGNVRELENIVQRCLVLARGPTISADDLPPSVIAAKQDSDSAGSDSPDSLPARIAGLERAAIEEALALEAGNQSRAAARLGISERALRYKLAKIRRSK